MNDVVNCSNLEALEKEKKGEKMKSVFLIFLLFAICTVNATDRIKFYSADSVEYIIDSVRVTMGANKEYPIEVEKPFFIALMHFPDLINTKIKMKRRNIKTTMLCRPTLGSIFLKPEKRTYKIIVDNKKNKDYGVIYEELPFEAQVGVLGHELAHIVDYNSKNGAEVIGMGIQYLNPSKRKEIEQKIDLLTIEHGLGSEIKDFAVFVFEESQASEKYKDYKRKYYYQPFQIKDILLSIPAYRLKLMLADD